MKNSAVKYDIWIVTSTCVLLLVTDKMAVTRRGRGQLGKSEVHVVTGGGGFPGFSLGKKLAAEGHRVRLFDIKEPVWNMQSGMEFVQVWLILLNCLYPAPCLVKFAVSVHSRSSLEIRFRCVDKLVLWKLWFLMKISLAVCDVTL